MRLMGLDVGTKTVGVALSDELGITAQALVTYRRTGATADLQGLLGLIVEHGVTGLVVGLPLHMNGEEGDRAVAARKLGDALGAQANIPVHYWDERLTTVAAQRALLEGDVSRAKRKEVIDQVAAVLILQGYLQSQAKEDDE